VPADRDATTHSRTGSSRERLGGIKINATVHSDIIYLIDNITIIKIANYK
jgi:hypothetical protein